MAIVFRFVLFICIFHKNSLTDVIPDFYRNRPLNQSCLIRETAAVYCDLSFIESNNSYTKMFVQTSVKDIKKEFHMRLRVSAADGHSESNYRCSVNINMERTMVYALNVYCVEFSFKNITFEPYFEITFVYENKFSCMFNCSFDLKDRENRKFSSIYFTFPKINLEFNKAQPSFKTPQTKRDVSKLISPFDLSSLSIKKLNKTLGKLAKPNQQRWSSRINKFSDFANRTVAMEPKLKDLTANKSKHLISKQIIENQFEEALKTFITTETINVTLGWLTNEEKDIRVSQENVQEVISKKKISNKIKSTKNRKFKQFVKNPYNSTLNISSSKLIASVSNKVNISSTKLMNNSIKTTLQYINNQSNTDIFIPPMMALKTNETVFQYNIEIGTEKGMNTSDNNNLATTDQIDIYVNTESDYYTTDIVEMENVDFETQSVNDSDSIIYADFISSNFELDANFIVLNRSDGKLPNPSNKPSLLKNLSETQWPVKHAAILEGDIVLGGLMMVHSREDRITCGPIMPQGGIQALETMIYTLDKINYELSILPNITIGAHILDDCDKDTYGLEMAVDFIKGANGMASLNREIVIVVTTVTFVISLFPLPATF